MSSSRFIPLITAALLLLLSCGGDDPTGPDPNLLRITTTSVPDAVLNVDYGTVTLTATGGDGSYTWVAGLDEPLPRGLSLAANGDITGTPTMWCFCDFTVEVSSAGKTKQQTFPIIIHQSP